MEDLARSVGESSLFVRTGGAPSLAFGMAHIFSQALSLVSGGAKAILSFWHHFAIMFEALFILTTIDAGTRVGRFLPQDLLGHVYAPLGGINSLWPLFGIANQLLGTIALCLATTVVIQQHGLKFVWVPAMPLGWMLSGTFTAGLTKIFAANPRLGFLARAEQIEATLAAGGLTAATATELRQLMFNERMDAIICGVFLVLTATIVFESARVWVAVLRGAKVPQVSETPFVPTQLQPGEI